MIKFLVKTIERGERIITAPTEEIAQIQIDVYAKSETIVKVVRIRAFI
mgnify:CR=1 FL=1